MTAWSALTAAIVLGQDRFESVLVPNLDCLDTWIELISKISGILHPIGQGRVSLVLYWFNLGVVLIIWSRPNAIIPRVKRVLVILMEVTASPGIWSDYLLASSSAAAMILIPDNTRMPMNGNEPYFFSHPTHDRRQDCIRFLVYGIRYLERRFYQGLLGNCPPRTQDTRLLQPR
jgi:hypothetical protein